MQALLIIAHGSRRPESNREVLKLAERIAVLESDHFDLVVAAFLELASPDIGTGVAECVHRGATNVVVVPYFLSAGRHVAEDIPAEIASAQARFPGVRLELRQHIGAADQMAQWVLSNAGAGAETEPDSD